MWLYCQLGFNHNTPTFAMLGFPARAFPGVPTLIFGYRDREVAQLSALCSWEGEGQGCATEDVDTCRS